MKCLVQLQDPLRETSKNPVIITWVPYSLRSRCRISVPIECLLKTKFLRLFMIRRMYVYQVANQNVAANILN